MRKDFTKKITRECDDLMLLIFEMVKNRNHK